MESVKRSIFIKFNLKILPYSNLKRLANFGPTETYYIPNSQKFHKDFYEVFQFELACIGLRNISVSSCPLFMHIWFAIILYKKSGLGKIKISSQPKQLSQLCKVLWNPHKISINLVYGRSR